MLVRLVKTQHFNLMKFINNYFYLSSDLIVKLISQYDRDMTEGTEAGVTSEARASPFETPAYIFLKILKSSNRI